MKTRHLLLTAVGLLAAVGCGNFRDRAVLSAGPWAVDTMELAGQISRRRISRSPFRHTATPWSSPSATRSTRASTS